MVGHDGRATGRKGRVADFNMDAPASGCASDLSRRSYDPLSTDNAAESYRDRSRGSPIPLLRHVRGPRGHRCRCRLFKQRDAGLFPPVTSPAIILRVVFSTLVYAAATWSSSSSSHRDLTRRSSPGAQLRSRIDRKIETGSGARREFTYGGCDSRG
jgi:hypothetical protein